MMVWLLQQRIPILALAILGPMQLLNFIREESAQAHGIFLIAEREAEISTAQRCGSVTADLFLEMVPNLKDQEQ